MEEEDAFAQTSSKTSIDVSEKRLVLIFMFHFLTNSTNKSLNQSLTLARKLRSLSHVEFLQLAQETYSTLLACIEISELHAQVLIELSIEARDDERLRKSRRKNVVDITTSPTANNTSLVVPGSTSSRPSISLLGDSLNSSNSSGGEDISLTSDISDVVHATAELGNLRFSKVIGVRTEIHASLSLKEFVEIFDASWSFVLRCEVICQRMIIGLRGVMVGQAKTFLQTYHQKRLSESAKLVENEQWGAAEVTQQTQKIVNLILASAVGDPSEFLIGKRKRLDNSSNMITGEEVVEVANTKQLDIEGREYFAVSAGLVSVEMLADYLKVVMNCPLLTTDTVSKVVEYMKVNLIRFEFQITCS